MRRRYYHHGHVGRRYYRGPGRWDYGPGRRRAFSARTAVWLLLALAALLVLASLV